MGAHKVFKVLPKMIEVLINLAVFGSVFGLFWAAKVSEGTFILSFIAVYVATAWVVYQYLTISDNQ